MDKRIVELPEIRETGEYIAELKLHPEVTAKVSVNVLANWALICFKMPYARCTIGSHTIAQVEGASPSFALWW